MSTFRRFQSTFCAVLFVAVNGVAAESVSWSKGVSDVHASDLYDHQTPCNLETCNVDVWRTRPPTLQFTMDLLYLDRSDSGGSPFLVDATTGQVLLNTGDIIDDPEPGVRLGLILMDSGGYDVEFSYLGLDTFGGVANRSSSNGITFPFFGGIPATARRSYSVDYRSEINSGELNVRRALGSQVSWLAGLRYIELRERFNINSNAGGFFSNTGNDLFGFQLGGDVQLFRVCDSLIFSTLKAGVYYNDAEVRALAANSGGALNLSDDEGVTAFTGDLTLGMLIPMGPSADLRLGYQGLFLDGVGLAPEQSTNFSLFTGSGSLDQSSVFFHGGFVGVDLFW